MIKGIAAGEGADSYEEINEPSSKITIFILSVFVGIVNLLRGPARTQPDRNPFKRKDKMKREKH